MKKISPLHKRSFVEKTGILGQHGRRSKMYVFYLHHFHLSASGEAFENIISAPQNAPILNYSQRSSASLHDAPSQIAPSKVQ
tara:strand:- start:230 stop:475 length:246 start_codon:yes stop_codon:yes gene_type:complete